MSKSCSVTVVIPTRDRAEMLASRSLPTALAQKGVAFEVIVVDDCSWPPVEVGADSRVRVIRHSAQLGVAAARNTGMRAASGEWIAFLDDDDIWSPDKLREQLRALEAGGDYCYSGAVVLDSALKPIRLVPPPSALQLLGRLLQRNVMPAGSSNVVVRGSLLCDLGGFDESFSHLDDWDCWLRLADGNTACVCERLHVAYVLHAGSRALGNCAEQNRELERLEGKHAGRSQRVARDFDRHDFARYLAVAQRRAGRRTAAARMYLGSARQYRSGGDVIRAGAALAGVPPRHQRRVEAPDWLAPQLPRLSK